MCSRSQPTRTRLRPPRTRAARPPTSITSTSSATTSTSVSLSPLSSSRNPEWALRQPTRTTPSTGAHRLPSLATRCSRTSSAVSTRATTAPPPPSPSRCRSSLCLSTRPSSRHQATTRRSMSPRTTRAGRPTSPSLSLLAPLTRVAQWWLMAVTALCSTSRSLARPTALRVWRPSPTPSLLRVTRTTLPPVWSLASC